MKRFFTFGFMLVAFCAAISAQIDTKQLGLFREFKPATIGMRNGKVVKAPFANIFLKNGALLFLKGEYTMEANMDIIKTVKIDSLYFVNIDNQMAQLIDSVGENRLYCVTLIDMDAFQANLKNNVVISANSFSDMMNSDQLSYSTVELESEEDRSFPIFRHFYYLYNGEIVRVHEREISRKLPKSKRHLYKSIMSLPDFSWVDVNSLMKMLKAISEVKKGEIRK